VVGNQQGARHGMRQIGLDLDAERIEQCSRPGTLQRQATAIAAPGKRQQRDQQATDDQQEEPEQAKCAGRKIGFVQFAYPR